MKFCKGLKKLIAMAVILSAVGAGGYWSYKKMTGAKAASTQPETTAAVTRGDLTVTISGSGTVAPISSYDIVPLVKGNVLSSSFEEGMGVKEGDILYTIDDRDLQIQIEKTKNSINKTNLNNQTNLDSIKNLVVTMCNRDDFLTV